jgi:hypothetical protein
MSSVSSSPSPFAPIAYSDWNPETIVPSGKKPVFKYLKNMISRLKKSA